MGQGDQGIREIQNWFAIERLSSIYIHIYIYVYRIHRSMDHNKMKCKAIHKNEYKENGKIHLPFTIFLFPFNSCAASLRKTDLQQWTNT